MIIQLMDRAWFETYLETRACGRLIAPRKGRATMELDHRTIAVDMLHPILRNPVRKVNYRFMATEASWILSGSDRLDEFGEHAAKMAPFSDNGETLYGAYGPRIIHQFDATVRKLLLDRSTRQATLTTWIPNHLPSKDVPCTVAMDFKIRDDKLNVHVFMRSSDIWLGLPYDVFSFTCVGLLIREVYNAWLPFQKVAPGEAIAPGILYLTAASSHLYEDNWDAQVLAYPPAGLPLPVAEIDQMGVRKWLSVLKRTSKGDPLRWWEEGL